MNVRISSDGIRSAAAGLDREPRRSPGDEGRGPALVDLGRRIGRREGVRRPVHRGRRHLGRHRDRRRSERAHRRHQPHRRRQSADRDAVQHRQAVRRAGRQRAPARPRRRRRRGQVARGPAAGDHRGRHPRRQVLRGAGQHPRHQLALVQQQGAGRCRHRRAQDLARGVGGGPEARGEGHRSVWRRAASPGRSGTLFNSRAGRPRRHRAVLPDLPRQRSRRGQERRSSRRWPSCSSSCRPWSTPGSPGRNWNDATGHGDHRQGRHAGHGRLGQGRVQRRRA